MTGKFHNPFLLLGLLTAVLLVGAGPHLALAAEVREPVWAGSFYPAEASELKAALDSYTRQARQSPIAVPNARLRALVMPHAGFIYSGLTAAHVGQVLKPGAYKKLLLLGPDHRVGLANAAVGRFTYYQTPLGLIPLHHEGAALLANSPLFISVPESDHREHSLEVTLPFLQYYLGDFALVPVVLGSPDTSRVVEALAPLIDRQTLLVISSDLSHFLPYDAAVAKDQQTIERILRLDSQGLAGDDNNACGRSGLLVLLELARRNHWQPRLLHYSNSGDTAGDRSRVVGYAALAFYENAEAMSMSSPANLSSDQGDKLVQLARQTITAGLKQPVDPARAAQLHEALAAPIYREKRGVFVTLHKHGQLRGCIGSLSGYRAIADGVRENALNAAFQDQRFRPVSVEELHDLEIEVSILSEPQPLPFVDGDDLRQRLRPGIDGVILRRGEASATFLPQVWAQLPDPALFLAQLCLKAGLSANDWRRPGLEVLTYQVQYFAEKP